VGEFSLVDLWAVLGLNQCLFRVRETGSVADYRLMGPDLLFRGVAALEVVRNRTLLALNLALFCSASLYVCYPVHAVPYTPARHFAKGRNDPGFRASGEDPDGSSAAGGAVSGVAAPATLEMEELEEFLLAREVEHGSPTLPFRPVIHDTGLNSPLISPGSMGCSSRPRPQQPRANDDSSRPSALGGLRGWLTRQQGQRKIVDE
jgi:hypothetical protein